MLVDVSTILTRYILYGYENIWQPPLTGN